MTYRYNQMIVKETKGKFMLPLVVAIALTLVMSVGVFAHGVRDIVNQDLPNCYGKVASMHAKDKTAGNGIKDSYAYWNHTAVPNLDNDASFQEEVKAIQDYCRAE